MVYSKNEQVLGSLHEARMIDIVVIVILLGLLVAVFTSSIPPRQEDLPEYRFSRSKTPNGNKPGGKVGKSEPGAVAGNDLGSRS
ncbi:MAG: hypothetical protein V4488_13020 [Pseudomonadota bacterium]